MNKRNIFIGIIILLVIMVAFWYLGGNTTSSSDSSLSASSNSVGSTDAQYIYSLLQQMQGVRLDDSIFSNPAFENLQDNTVSFSSEPAGRDNPFAPIDGSLTPATGQSGSLVNVNLQ